MDGRDFWFEFPVLAAYLVTVASGEAPSARGRTGAREKPREKPGEKILARIAELPTITTAEPAEVLSARDRLEKIVADVLLDMETRDRLKSWSTGTC